jgi:hypothetical protein
MYSAWTASSTGLPHEGQPIEFLLDDRLTVMDGIYVQRTFRSRWTGYEVERVRTWRSSDSSPSDTRVEGVPCAA